MHEKYKCDDCGRRVSFYAHLCNYCKLKGNRSPRFKGGKPRCVDCGVQLARYKALRCRKCRGLWMRIPENNWSLGRKFRPGSITKSLYYRIRDSATYKSWRLEVFDRDGYQCMDCGDDSGGNLNANHIKKFITILEENNIKTFSEAMACDELWNINNGITLCVPCHRLTYGKEELLEDKFNKILYG